MSKTIRPIPIKSSEEIVLGEQYLIVMFFRATLVAKLVTATKKEKEKFEFTFVRGTRVLRESHDTSVNYRDHNINGGGYNHHHVFRNTPRNLKFFLDLLLSQDWEGYLSLY
jgi:hypothetical protein